MPTYTIRRVSPNTKWPFMSYAPNFNNIIIFHNLNNNNFEKLVIIIKNKICNEVFSNENKSISIVFRKFLQK